MNNVKLRLRGIGMKMCSPVNFVFMFQYIYSSSRFSMNHFIARVPSTSRLIKTAGLTAAELSGRRISTLTANWTVSRRASPGTCCLMIKLQRCYLIFADIKREICLILLLLVSLPAESIFIIISVLQIQQQEHRHTTRSGL